MSCPTDGRGGPCDRTACSPIDFLTFSPNSRPVARNPQSPTFLLGGAAREDQHAIPDFPSTLDKSCNVHYPLRILCLVEQAAFSSFIVHGVLRVL